jgi:hypothetical protein
MVRGILSPFSSARMIRNCPGRAALAMRGAFITIFAIVGFSIVFSRISNIILVTVYKAFA